MRTALAFLGLLLALCGCGPKAGDNGASSNVLPTATTAEQGAALQAAQKAIGDCLATNHCLKAFEACAVPLCQREAFKACALKAAGEVKVTTRAGRQRYYQVLLPNWVVQAQASTHPTPSVKKTP